MSENSCYYDLNWWIQKFARMNANNYDTLKLQYRKVKGALNFYYVVGIFNPHDNLIYLDYLDGEFVNLIRSALASICLRVSGYTRRKNLYEIVFSNCSKLIEGGEM